MRIEDFLKNPVLLSEEEQKAILSQQAELKVNFPGINIDLYIQLLPVMKAASQAEQRDQTPSQQMQTAREHAAKLAVLFGSFDEAILYLTRYEQRYPNERQNVHDACLFSLPTGQCDIAMWRAIVAKNAPSSPQDAILRILPFAEKIESHVNANRVKLAQSIRDEVTSEFESQISQKFDELPVTESKEAWIEKQLATRQKVINKNTEVAFDAYLRGQLGLPSGKQVKLDETQRELAKELRSRLNKPTSEEDIKKYGEIKAEQTQIEREKIEKSYVDNILSVANQDKSTYVIDRLNAAKGTIDAVVRERMTDLLSANTPLSTLQNYANCVCYTHGAKNPLAASLFFAKGMPEERFNQYLLLRPQDDAKYIPAITIKGSEINPAYAELTLEKLDPSNPEAAILGKFTSCCQSLGQEGEKPTIYGITHPRAGFYVLRDAKGIIVAQCLAWRSESNTIVFDSLESKVDFRRRNPMAVSDIYTYLANRLVREHDVWSVTVGTGGETPASLGVCFCPSAMPVDYNGYRDSKKQRLIAAQQFPAFQLYTVINLSSTLFNPNERVFLTWKMAKMLCDRTLENDKKNGYSRILPFLAAKGITIEGGDAQVVDYLVKQGISVDVHIALGEVYLHVSLAVVEYLVEQGANVTAQMVFSAAETNLDVFKYFVGRVKLNAEENSRLLLAFISIRNFEIVKYFVEKSEVNVAKTENILALAAETGRLDMVKYFIDNGVHIEANSNILSIAAKTGELPLLQYFIEEKGVNVAEENNVLLAAAASGNLDMVKYLIDEKGVNVAEAQHILSFAVSCPGTFALVKYLIEEKGVLSVAEEKEILWMAAQHAIHGYANSSWDMVNYLIERGADITVKDRNGKTVLYSAYEAKRWDTVKCLLEHGADATEVLFLAIDSGYDEMFEYLVKHAKNISAAEDKYGLTGLYLICERDNLDMFKCFVANGADTNEALHCAIKKGNLNMIQYLVEEANVNLSVDKSILRLTRDFEIFKYLVDHGADTHEVLSAAIWSSDGDIVQYLVDNRINGIDANTALSLAVQLDNIGIAKYLVDHGANPNSVGKGWDESTWEYALRNNHEELIAFLNLFPKTKTEPQPAPSTAQAALGEWTSYTEVMAKTPTGEGSTPNSDEHSEVDVVNRPHN